MWRDPIVEEVRAIRDAYAKAFDYDLDAIFNDLKKQQAGSDAAFVILSPKRIKPACPLKPAFETKAPETVIGEAI